jgi:hypothetical protein
MDSDPSLTATPDLQDQLAQTQRDLQATNQSIQELVKQRQQNAILLRGAGYALLLITLVIFISFFIPSRFGDSAWQQQLIGKLVQNVGFPVVGVTLLLFSGKYWRNKRELHLLRGISHALLGVALAYFLLLPLGLSTTVRLYNQNQAEMGAGLDRKLEVLQQLETQIQAANSDQDLNKVLERMQGQPKLPENVDSKAVKQQLLTQLSQAKADLKSTVKAQGERQRFGLIKTFMGQSFLAILATGIFAWFWMGSRWARSSQSFRQRKKSSSSTPSP